jgi:hypothetical protein
MTCFFVFSQFENRHLRLPELLFLSVQAICLATALIFDAAFSAAARTAIYQTLSVHKPNSNYMSGFLHPPNLFVFRR